MSDNKEIPDWLNTAAVNYVTEKHSKQAGDAWYFDDEIEKQTFISGATSPEAARYHQSPVVERDERLVWVKASERLPDDLVNGNFHVKHKDGRQTRQYWNGTGFINFNTFSWNYFSDIVEWLSETPSHEGKDAVAFADFICNGEWVEHRKLKPEQTTYWMNDSISGNYTTAELYSLYTESIKQHL